MNQEADGQIEDSAWKTLYRIGGIAALVAAIGFRRNLSAEISLTGVEAPHSAGGWFDLLQSRPLLGLAMLDLFDVVNYALLGLVFIALYVALRQVNRSATLIALCSGLVGVTACFSSNPAFAMLALSDQYAAAAESSKGMFLAAGEAVLAIENPGTPFDGTGAYMALLLVSIAALMFSIVMLRGGVFSRVTAYFGIVGNALILTFFIFIIFAPPLTFIPHSAGAIPLVVWEILLGLRLLQLAKA